VEIGSDRRDADPIDVAETAVIALFDVIDIERSAIAAT